MTKPLSIATALILTTGFGMAAGFAIAKSVYPPVEVLVSSTKSIIGQEITYPNGPAKVTGAIVTMQPGAETGWHKHDVPLFAWIIEGEVTVDYADAGKRTYRQGDAFIEAFQSRHNGQNTGKGLARILAVFAGAEDIDNTVVEKN